MEQTGFWWKIGHAFYKYFSCLEWTYDNLSPNKIFIALGFICFAWWMMWQNKFNQKALKDGGLK